MRALLDIARIVFGLFVDDGSLAAVIIGWIVLWGVIPIPNIFVLRWGGVTFFAGLALILIENVLRVARMRRRRRRLNPPE